MTEVILALTIGIITGALAGAIIRKGLVGIVVDMLIGMVGSILGAWTLLLLGAESGSLPLVPAGLAALIGAMLLTALVHALPRKIVA